MGVGLTRYAWGTLAFNVVVILMGAVVRATGSGAGCGRSWPTCQGEVVPELSGDTAIEFAHRGLSGVALVLVAFLVVLVLRRVERPHQVRATAVWSLIAIIGEALIGAAIVLFEWVADDASIARAVSVPLHLLNTFLLLAALALTAHLLGGGAILRPRSHRAARRWLTVGAAAFLVVAATGAVTALADTLFPKQASATETIEHFLTELRVIHPIVALSVVVVAAYALTRRGVGGRTVNVVSILVLVQMLSGVLVIFAGLPLGLRLLHLALADVLWVAYVVMAAHLLAGDKTRTAPTPVIGS